MDYYIGLIQYYGFNFAPRGTMLCNGATLSIAQNQALFSLLGTTYGGDGVTTFKIPDFRGRSAYGTGGSTTLGQIGGKETATIPLNSMPVHTHTVTGNGIPANSAEGDLQEPRGSYPAQPNTRANMYSTTKGTNNFGAPIATVANTGNNAPFNVLAPYLALTCCIVTSGLYPPRP